MFDETGRRTYDRGCGKLFPRVILEDYFGFGRVRREDMQRTENEWIELFQWFHMHPELGDQEYETTEKICGVLRQIGVEILPSTLKTGVIGVIRGAFPGRTVCLRADIDALPVQEEADVPYRSGNPGKMHACGHDFHTTAALYAASLLQERRGQLHGKILLLFQPAEEIIDGGREAVETNLLRDVEEFYGFHAEPSLETGEISIESGCVMAAVDRFAVTVTGRGCHAAAPHLGNNPVPVMASVISQIQAFAARGTDPLQPRVVSVTHAAAGEVWNVIPEQAFMEGTVRSMDERERGRIRQNIDRIVESHAAMAEVRAEISWHPGQAAVINDAALCRAARAVCERLGHRLAPLPPAMLGDDFSELTRCTEGSVALYVKIGTGAGAPLHSPLFRVDPAAIGIAGRFFAELLPERTAGA